MIVLIGHVSKGGSITAQPEKHPQRMIPQYPHEPEVLMVILSMAEVTYFTLINTAYFAGTWVPPSKRFRGNLFIHTASGGSEAAPNF